MTIAVIEKALAFYIKNCSLLMISIFSEAVKKNSNNLMKDWTNQLLDMTWKSAPTKAKFLSTASSQDNIWMNGKTLEEVD